MRMRKTLLICLCCLLAVPAVWGQAASSQTQHGILGYLDPQTGAFRPVPPPAEEAAEFPALTTFTGTITVTITVTVKTTAIKNVDCTADVSVTDAVTTTPRFFAETNTVAATGTGSTKTCSLSIPYSWGLATQSTDMMSTSYSVAGAASTTGTLPLRSSSLTPLDTRKVPSSGTTTALTAAVTI